MAKSIWKLVQFRCCSTYQNKKFSNANFLTLSQVCWAIISNRKLFQFLLLSTYLFMAQAKYIEVKHSQPILNHPSWFWTIQVDSEPSKSTLNHPKAKAKNRTTKYQRSKLVNPLNVWILMDLTVAQEKFHILC